MVWFVDIWETLRRLAACQMLLIIVSFIAILVQWSFNFSVLLSILLCFFKILSGSYMIGPIKHIQFVKGMEKIYEFVCFFLLEFSNLIIVGVDFFFLFLFSFLLFLRDRERPSPFVKCACLLCHPLNPSFWLRPWAFYGVWSSFCLYDVASYSMCTTFHLDL